MSTLCPYSIIKGDDELSVKVEWDVHYLTDEQIGTVRKYVAETEAENAELWELVRDYEELAAALCDARECDGCPFDSEWAICEHMRLIARVGELGVEV